MRSFCALIVFVLAFAATQQAEAGDRDWWKHGVFYQIYPRSFRDSNNDGIGDLQGIIQKLHYLKQTGITALWLSPIYESPQVDGGYDISNYTNINPDYGTVADLKTLFDTAHQLGLKVILDFVPNHTSDKHQWFINSENRVEGYEDFYVWADAKKDADGNNVPPNNWVSLFKNSSWQWSDKRQQYYLRQFSIAQPDLNYRNPKVVEKMKDVLRFWLDKGVDGFRIDAVPYLVEDEQLRDEPLSGLPGYNSNDYEYLSHIYTANAPETYDIIYDWRSLLDEYTLENGGDQRIMMTEAYTDESHTMLYYGTPDGSRLGAHFAFNFNLITDVNINSTAQDFANAIEKWLKAMPHIYTSNWVLGNHDNHRVATRFGPENADGMNMLMALLPGIGVTYNGEEIAQEDGEVSFEEGQDPSATDPATFDKVSRDFERTPFQWDDSINAGFNEGAEPWLPVSSKYKETNLAAQDVPGKKSHYHIYQYMMQWRQYSACVNGTTEVGALNEGVLVLRRVEEETAAVLLFNLGNKEESVDVSGHVSKENAVLESSLNSNFDTWDKIDPEEVTLQPHECIVLVSATD